MLQSRSDIVVRKPQALDAEALTELFALTWRLAYSGIIPHLHLEGTIRRRNVEWWRSVASRGDGMLILEVNGEVAGYTSFTSRRPIRASASASTCSKAHGTRSTCGGCPV